MSQGTGGLTTKRLPPKYRPDDPKNLTQRRGNYGGASTVTPRATGDGFAQVDKYIDQSYNNALNRLQPQMEQGRDALTQSLIDRGIGVGSEAHSEAMRTQGQVENDALQNAAFQAMGFGTGLQNQLWNQDFQAKGMNLQNAQAMRALAEQGRQADMGNAFNYAGLNEQARQFQDQSARAWDQAAFRDLSWLDNQNFRNRQYNDSRDDLWFNMRQALLGAIPGWNPAQIDVNGAANSATNSQQAAFDAGMAQDQAMWNNIGTAAGAMMAFSDPALKADVKRIGTVNGFNWYRWNWNDLAGDLFGLKGESEGVMADEVPAEMTGMRDGFLTVDYARVMA